MGNQSVILEVLSGPDKGTKHKIREVSIIGRGDHCEVVLNDPTISWEHARISFDPFPHITDMESINHVFHNGEQVIAADLEDGDRIRMGDTTVQVHLIEEEVAPERDDGGGSKKVGLILLSVVFILVSGGIMASLYYKQKQKLETTPVVVKKYDYDVLLSEKYEGFPPVHLSLPLKKNSFYPHPTVSGNSISSRQYYPFSKRKEKSQYEDYYPVDPLSINLNYNSRNWGVFPPRLGNGRFLWACRCVAGDYYAYQIFYINKEYQSTVPDKYRELTGSKKSPLRFNLFIEIWTGLPYNLPLGAFSPGLKPVNEENIDRHYENMPSLPIWAVSAASQTLPIISESQEECHFGFRKSYWKYRGVMKKRGDTILITTAYYFPWQEKRVKGAIDAIFEKQRIENPIFSESPLELVNTAKKMEQKADQIVPGVENYNNTDWYGVKTCDLVTAFRYYKKALLLYQKADRWDSSDYNSIFIKAEKIYEFVQSPDSFFYQGYKQIMQYDKEGKRENARNKAKQIREQLNILFNDEEFPAEEWFIYALSCYKKLI